MNRIIYPMKVLAVKLDYLRQRLECISHGHYKTVKGQQYVVIDYDPENPRYDSRHPRVVACNTKLGQELGKKVNEYSEVEKQYKDLLVIWNSTYKLAPPRVEFPIIQYYDPHKMNNAYFCNRQDRCGKYLAENPTVSDHGELKSKNEQIGADLLKLMGIPFKYETELYLESIEQKINPDYLINFYEIDRCAYLEILGMNDKANYSANTAVKINGFSRDCYRPGREVIYVILYDKQNFDEDYFVSQVLSAFNDMIPDSAIKWGNCG